MQDRWLDPDCEYTRPIDPSSSYVPTGPADSLGADRLAKGEKGSMGPTVDGNTNIAASCTAEGTRTDASEPHTYKGQRVSTPSLVCLLFRWPWAHPAAWE